MASIGFVLRMWRISPGPWVCGFFPKTSSLVLTHSHGILCRQGLERVAGVGGAGARPAELAASCRHCPVFPTPTLGTVSPHYSVQASGGCCVRAADCFRILICLSRVSGRRNENSTCALKSLFLAVAAPRPLVLGWVPLSRAACPMPAVQSSLPVAYGRVWGGADGIGSLQNRGHLGPGRGPRG